MWNNNTTPHYHQEIQGYNCAGLNFNQLWSAQSAKDPFYLIYDCCNGNATVRCGLRKREHRSRLFSSFFYYQPWTDFVFVRYFIQHCWNSPSVIVIIITCVPTVTGDAYWFLSPLKCKLLYLLCLPSILVVVTIDSCHDT